ncbi:MAG: hypothetical protein O7E49_14425, partial [Gemmatimonadetes bacterium]|nr:hypothetical protein [Gemmatimonadota bacterium]
VHADFHYPARLDDVLQVAAYISRVGNKSITMQFDVMLLGANRLVADGHLVLVSTDRTRLASRVLPKTFVSRLEPFTLSVDEARRQLGWAGAGTGTGEGEGPDR